MRDAGLMGSVGAADSGLDNALLESVFGFMHGVVLDRRTSTTKVKLSAASVQ